VHILANSTNQSQRKVSDEGRKILYRLLLFAVSIIYALVFILDYLLQLQFTFFLLLSLFGFVILTLLYMWFRVSVVEPLEPAEETDIQPETSPEKFQDAQFLVNMLTGLTIDCTSAACSLFEADSVSELSGIDLSGLMAVKWSVEENTQIRRQLKQTNKASAIGTYVSLKGRVFKGLMQASRLSGTEEKILAVRITDLSNLSESIPSTARAETGTIESDYTSRLLFEEGIVPIAFVGINYKFEQVNKAFCDLLGYSKEELKQLTVLDIVFPDDKVQERKNLSLVFSGESPVSKKEKRFVRRNGDVIWVNTSSTLVRNESNHPGFVLTMAENITRRKRIEYSTHAKKDKLNSLLDNAEYSIISVDRHCTILLINAKLCDILFSLTGIVVETGYNVMDVLPASFREEFAELHRRAFTGEHFVHEKKIVVSGNAVDIELVFTPVTDENGKVLSVSIFGHNITERKKQEEELIRQKTKAESATAAKSGFLATMSHEIRTPLNGVIGMGRLLSDTPLTPKQQDYVDSLLLSGEALLSVINDILDYSKIESAKMELEEKPFAIRRCIEETFDLLSARAIEKKLSLQYSISRDVPTYIIGDIVRLRQILMNLVGNAIKFTPAGKITVRVSAVSWENENYELLFSVKDTGIGIPKDKIGNLFQSYSQADKSTAGTYGGTGLGLMICKNLVNLMEGKIWVESDAGKGSDFLFTIRTRKVSSSAVPEQVRTGSNRLVNSHVLLIADDKSEADIYYNYFKRWSMIPRIEYGIQAGLDLIREHPEYSLVLIDAQMTSTKPLEIAGQLRRIRSQDELPIILFNADKGNEIFYDYTGELVSAVIPGNVDRSKVLDILIGVFSVEDHQRSQHEAGLKIMTSRLADEYPLNILIAEDNMINQKLVQNIFEGLGYKPVIVSNGLQVLEKLKSSDFDLIFMDIQMPEMDGLEATRFIIEKVDATRRPVIVAMTAFALEGDKAKCIEAGMNDYISKPFMVEEIVEKIKRWSKPRTIPPSGSINTTEMDVIQKQVLLDEMVLNRLREMAASADMDFFGEVMRMFIQQGREIIADVEKLCLNHEWEKMSQQAHKLKGSSLNIGANLLAETCRMIEIKGKEAVSQDCVSLTKRLRTDFETTVMKILEVTGLKED
jgi:PAS domain S-box-containing protein